MSETIYALGFLILDARVASFRMSRFRVLLCDHDRPGFALVLDIYICNYNVFVSLG